MSRRSQGYLNLVAPLRRPPQRSPGQQRSPVAKEAVHEEPTQKAGEGGEGEEGAAKAAGAKKMPARDP